LHIILLETGPIDALPAWETMPPTRCVDGVRTSNRKKKGEGNTKNGNKYLAWAFVEAANFARRFCPGPGGYERKRPKTTSSPSRRWPTSWRVPAITS
jgi:hypothetical protein